MADGNGNLVQLTSKDFKSDRESAGARAAGTTRS